MRRNRNKFNKNYNLQGWTDVRKLIVIIQYFESKGIRTRSMSDLLTMIVDMQAMRAEKQGFIEIESISDAFEWLKQNGYTTAQLDGNDKRKRFIANAIEDEDKIIEDAYRIGQNLINGGEKKPLPPPLQYEMDVLELVQERGMSRTKAEDLVDPEFKFHPPPGIKLPDTVKFSDFKGPILAGKEDSDHERSE